MNNCTKETFIKEFSKQLRDEKASLFIGSGISRKSGYAGWKDILKDCAEEIGLCVEKEKDLITLAEFYVRGKQRTKINNTIAEYFKDAKGSPSKTHELLATLPIRNIWTTNYDTLIERSLMNADIQYSVLTDDRSYIGLDNSAKVKIHKIHGNVNVPSECIITRKDYEKFEANHDIVLSELKGDMCTNSFLFLGYGFNDIDIQHILSRIRLIYKEEHPQRHFCILEKINKDECIDEEDYVYQTKRQNHHVADMQSYGLNVVLVDSYNEIEDILEELSLKVHIKDVLISGAYEDSNTLAKNRIAPVAKLLSEKLIELGFKIYTGYGKNLGADIVSGAFSGCGKRGIKAKEFNSNVFLFPFPYNLQDTSNRSDIYTALRKNMIMKTRISIFICGQKSTPNGTINSPGVLEEYKISNENNNLIIPVSTTGAAAKQIWNEENQKGKEIAQENFNKLDTLISPSEIVENIVQFINKYIEQNN